MSAARILVEEHGPDRFSMSDACRAAGVSTAAPYRHFRNKDELLQAAAREGLQRLGERMRAARRGRKAGSVERIAAMGQNYVRFATSEPGIFRLVFGGAGADERCESTKEEGQRTFGILMEEVAAYLECDIEEEEVLHRSFALWTFVHGISFLEIDAKVDKMRTKIDIDAMIRDATARLLPLNVR